MTSNEFEAWARSLLPVARRRKPCTGDQCRCAELPHGDDGRFCGADGTLPDDSPAAVMARALVDGQPAVEGEVCPECDGYGAYIESSTNVWIGCSGCGGHRHYRRFTLSAFPDVMKGTGRIGARLALAGLLGHEDEGVGVVSHDHRECMEGGECLFVGPDCHGTGVVLNDLARQLLDAGYELAVVGMAEQLLGAIEWRLVWHRETTVSLYSPEGWLAAKAEAFSIHGPTRLDAMTDAISQACGVEVG